MGKKIVAIVGSYRRGRTIETAVSQMAKGAEAGGAEVTIVNLLDKHIEFCTNCRKCTQQPDVKVREQCIHDDDMGEILDLIDAADGLILASPINFGDVTALMKRFIERLIVYAYWPWETYPKNRIKKTTRKAVAVTSSAAPAMLARLFMRAPRSVFKMATKAMGAKTIASLHFGMAAFKPDSTLTKKQSKRAYRAGRKLAD